MFSLLPGGSFHRNIPPINDHVFLFSSFLLQVFMFSSVLICYFCSVLPGVSFHRNIVSIKGHVFSAPLDPASVKVGDPKFSKIISNQRGTKQLTN